MCKKMERRDWLALGALILGVLALFLALGRDGGRAERVQIWVDGALIQELALGQDARVPVETSWGCNVVVIQDGEVWIASSDCPGQECVAQGPIRQAGQALICLPHRLSVQLTGQESGVDIIAS